MQRSRPNQIARIGGRMGQLATHVGNFIVDIAGQKTRRDAASDIHQKYYGNQQYFRYDLRTATIRDVPALLNGTMFNRFTMLMNHTASYMMAREFTSQGVPAGSSREDLLAAETVTQLLSDHHYRNNREVEDRLLAISLVLERDCFVRMSYDPEKLGVLVLDPQDYDAMRRIFAEHGEDFRPVGEPQVGEDGKLRINYRIGGTVEQRVNANLVFPEAGAKSWDEVTRYATVDFMPIRLARKLYPNASKDFVPWSGNKRYATSSNRTSYAYTGGGDGGSPQQDADAISYEQEVTRVVQYWEKVSDRHWDVATFSGSSLDNLCEEPKSMPNKNLVHFGYLPMGTEQLWSQSVADAIRPLQFTLNMLVNNRLKYLHNSLKDVIVKPSDADVKLDNSYNLVITLPPGAKGSNVQFIPQTSGTLEILGQAVYETMAQMDELTGFTPAVRGEGGDRLSGASINARRASASGPIDFARSLQQKALRERDEIALSMMTQMYSLPRLATVIGDYSEVGIKLVQSSDVRSGTSLRLVEKGLSSEDILRRQELVQYWAQNNLLGPETQQIRENIYDFVMYGVERKLDPEEVVQAERQAASEHSMMREVSVNQMTGMQGPRVDFMAQQNMAMGEVPPPPKLVDMETGAQLFNELQLHEVHVAEHKMEFNRNEGDPQFQQKLAAHIQEHQDFLAMVADQERISHLEYHRELAMAQGAANLASTAIGNMGGEGEIGPKSSAEGGRESGRTRRR